MAKRSIEIAISATNNTAGAFEKAKADAQRFANEVQRIQQNVRVGGDAFGGGLGRAESGLASARGRAFELQRLAERSAAETSAWQQNARFDRERFTAIRASVGATDDLAGSQRKVATETARANAGMNDMAGAAVKVATVLAVARAATAAMEIATGVINGDWKAITDAIKSVPVLGRAAEAGAGLTTAIHNKLAGTGPEWQAGVDEANAEGLARIADAEKKAAADAAFKVHMRDMGSEANREYEAGLAAKDKLHAEKMADADARDAAAADAAREAATGIAVRSMEHDAEMAAYQKNQDPVAARHTKMYTPVSAFDRGFLTQAPGSTFDQSKAKHAEATAKATEKTAKAAEKTAVSLDRMELNFRELLFALRPSKIIDF